MYRCFLIFLSGLFLIAGCAPPTPSTSWLTVNAPPGDPAGEDVTKALIAQREAICQALEVECTFPVQVELFSSQADFDAHAMNPDYRGFYAISGQGRIQMVTPSKAPAGRDIPYEERVQVAVHEFVHLVLDQIDPNLPDWIDEGTAVYLGPHDLYDQALRQEFPAEMLPCLSDLVESYDSVPAADLFAYILVRFIVVNGGLDRLNALVRSAAEREAYIEQVQEADWQRFLEQTVPVAASTASAGILAGLQRLASIIIDQRGCGYSQPSLKYQGQDWLCFRSHYPKKILLLSLKTYSCYSLDLSL